MIIRRTIRNIKIPSVNEIWRRGRHSTYLKPEVVELKKELDKHFEPEFDGEKELFNENVNVILSFGFNSIENKDVDNYAKIPIDSIKTRLIEDDTQIHSLLLMKEKTEGEETLDVSITATSNSLFALFSIDDFLEIYETYPLLLNKLILNEKLKYEIIIKNPKFKDILVTNYETKKRLIEEAQIYVDNFVYTEKDLKSFIKKINDLNTLKNIEKYIIKEVESTYNNKLTKLRRESIRNGNTISKQKS